MAKSLKNPDQQQQPSSREAAPAPVRNPYPPGFNPVVQARKLYKAMKGMGTDERAIFDVLRSGRADLNRAIETAFNRMYSTTLRDWLDSDLSGSDYTKAIQLLGRGDFTLTQKLNQAADGWGTDEEKIFHALEVAPRADLAEVRNNAYLMNRLRSELNNDDYRLALAYLNGQGALAAKLRRAVNGWGTDEAAIWRAIDKASEADRQFVLKQPSLMAHLRSDFSSDDYLRARRMLNGTWDNVDKIEVAMKGIGTDEAMLVGAIAGLSQAEFAKLEKGTTELPNGISSLKHRLKAELSGADEFEALENLHQKELAFDANYALKYREAQAKKLGDAALADAGAAALMASDGQSMSAVAQLRKACVGWGTDEESIWDVCARIPSEQGRWILKYNPENITGMLRSDLGVVEYFKVRSALGGGAWGNILVLKNAVEGVGTNEKQIYTAIDSIIAEGVGREVLEDGHVLRQLKGDLDSRMYDIFVEALETSQFTPMHRLGWATARYGTDEELVWEVCAQYGSEWFSGGEIRADVDEILRSELSTRDYWKAKDAIRGEPSSEQEKLERSKEMLERERSSGLSVMLVDSISDSGQNADEAWREYQVTYNQAYEDGKVSEEEQARLREAEDYSNYTTEQYREAKASFAQWASQIAITIVGIVATVLTAGAAAGPFIAALTANAGTIATTMVAAAALKVGIHKAIEGEGYDLSSMDTLVDGVGAAIEGGLFVVGNLGAAKIMQGLSKSGYAASIGPSVETAFGGAGKRILGAGLEGAIDGTIGGMGEGLFRGLANDKTWAGSMGDAFSNIGATTLLHTTLGGGMGMAGGALFKSIGETFGPSVRKLLAKGTAEGMAPGSGSVDDVMAKMPDDLDSSMVDRKRLTEAAFETNQRMQEVADSVTDEFGLPPTKVGLKGNKFGTDDISKVDEDAFIGKVLEKQRRWKEPEAIGEMTDMSRGRFDVDSFDEATAIAESLESRFTKAFGSDNVDVTPPRDVYKRYHILVRDPQTGVWHEWQIGTNALTKFIEEVPVKLPKGVELHGDDFHVVMYDVLSKLDDQDVRLDHGLPDNIVDDIGLGALQKKYDDLMVEAGTATKGAPEPINFDSRLAELADELGDALENLERKHPGLATKLDTKLAADKAAKARAAAQPGSDAPAPKAKGGGGGGQGAGESSDKFWEAEDFLGGKMSDAEAAAVMKELEAEIATLNLSPDEIAKRKLQKGMTGLNNAPEEWLPKYVEIQRGVKADGGDLRKLNDGFSDIWGQVSDGNARHAAEAATIKVNEYKTRMANGEVATGKLHWSQYGDTPEAAVHSLRRLSKTYSLLDIKGGKPNPTARARAEVFDTLADWAEKTEGLVPGRRPSFPEGPAHQPDMPAANTTTKATTGPDGQQPKVRPEHESSVEYKEYKNAVAFSGEGSVNPHSAQQGALGDCYLLAGAAAEARANPAGVRRLIKDNGDGTFDVTLYFREDWWSDPVAKTVTVDGKLPTKGGSPVYAKVGKSESGEDEIWMALFEKALAKETGSYDLISGGNITKHTNFGGVHELLTGNKVKMVNTDSIGEDALLRRMSDALENKEPVAVGTYNFNDDSTARVAAEKLNIYANHAYSIESVDLDARTVSLQNPWGSRHPTNVSIEDFRKYYKRLDIGTSAKSNGPSVGGDQFEGGGTGGSILRGLSNVGDKVGIGVGRGSNAATALASSQTRNEASKELKATSLGPGDILFPGEVIRNQFWAHLTAPDLVKFEGKLGGIAVVFFVAPSGQAVVVSSLEGQYLTAFAAPQSLIAHLLSQGEMQ